MTALTLTLETETVDLQASSLEELHFAPFSTVLHTSTVLWDKIAEMFNCERHGNSAAHESVVHAEQPQKPAVDDITIIDHFVK